MKKQIFALLTLCGSAFAVDFPAASDLEKSIDSKVYRADRNRVYVTMAPSIPQAQYLTAMGENPVLAALESTDIGVGYLMNFTNDNFRTLVELNTSLGESIFKKFPIVEASANELFLLTPESNTSLYLGAGGSYNSKNVFAVRGLAGIEFDKHKDMSKKLEVSYAHPVYDGSKAATPTYKVGFGIGF